MFISGVLRMVEKPRPVNIWISLTTENHFGLFVTLHICVKYDTQQNVPPQKEKKREIYGRIIV